MKKYVIDTNAIISYLTDRNPAQQGIIASLFEELLSVKSGIIIIDSVFSELVYVMQSVYETENKLIKEIVLSLTRTAGIEFDAGFDVNSILEIWPEKIPDYGDASLASYALNNNIPVITFDKQLIKKLKMINVRYFDLH